MEEVSPFQTPWFLQAFANNFIEKNFSIDMSFPFEKQGSALIFLGMRKVSGKEEVTDYGDITIDPSKLIQKAKEIGCNQIVLDYVREDSNLYSFYSTQKNVSIHFQEVAPFIRLPQTWEDYLINLDRVERKELKRKLKRLQTVPHSFEIFPSSDVVVFSEFIRLHKLSDANKEKFMTSSMEKFFYDLATADKKEWKSFIALLKIEDKPAAAIYFFEHKKKVLLYNSGFDPIFKYYSNGLMLHALLIKRNIENGIQIHDFLRGSERYKYDLGAKDLNLYKISITL